MTRAAIYARVSSQAQRERHTIENQLRVLPAFVAAQGWELVDTYVDDGRSAKAGMLDARTGFARLALDAERHRFDVLVVADIDRLTRTDDMRERAEILGPFQRAGVRIVTPAGGELDLRTMLGELYVTLQAIVAAEENRKRAERVKAGKQRAIAEGRKPAGPTPFGWRYDRTTGAWSVDDAAAAIVREIFARVAAGESCVAIADDLVARDARPTPRTGWSRAAVYRIVRSRTPLGEWSADKARGAVIPIPPLLTEDQWQAASRALLAHRRRGLRRTKHVYLLEGIARCGACGASIAIRSATRNPRRTNGNPSPAVYVCRARKLARACSAPIVKCADLDARIWAALCDELTQPALLEALAQAESRRDLDARDWTADARGYRAHLTRLGRVEQAVVARFRRGLVSEGTLDHELAGITRERKAVRAQLETTERALAGATAAAGGALAQLRAALPHATAEDRRELLRELALDGGVVVTNGRVRLDLRLLRPGGGESGGEPGDSSPVAPLRAADCRTQHGASLRLRLVA